MFLLIRSYAMGAFIDGDILHKITTPPVRHTMRSKFHISKAIRTGNFHPLGGTFFLTTANRTGVKLGVLDCPLNPDYIRTHVVSK